MSHQNTTEYRSFKKREEEGMIKVNCEDRPKPLEQTVNGF